MNRPPLTDEEGEVRELTLEDFQHMRPMAETHPDALEAFKNMKKQGGRPKVEAPKTHIKFRIAADIVEGIKSTGKGYNARVEQVLREALAAGRLDAPLDLLGKADP